MKVVCYVLLLANLGLLSWQLSHRAPTSRAQSEPVRAHTPARQLARLSEVSPRELRSRLRSKPVIPVEPVVTADEPSEPVMAGSASPEPRPHGADGHRGARCSTFGPLPSEERMQALRGWVESQGAQTLAASGERREITLYWVYLPPASSEADAEERVRQMRSDGIEDIFLIARGNMANAISLGMYSRPDTLARRVELLRVKGYEPAVAPRLRTEQGIWLDVRWPARAEHPEHDLDRRFPGVRYTDVSCAGLQFAGDRAITYNPRAAVHPAPVTSAQRSAATENPGFE